jgi:hypothetical protein
MQIADTTLRLWPQVLSLRCVPRCSTGSLRLNPYITHVFSFMSFHENDIDNNNQYAQNKLKMIFM